MEGFVQNEGGSIRERGHSSRYIDIYLSHRPKGGLISDRNHWIYSLKGTFSQISCLSSMERNIRSCTLQERHKEDQERGQVSTNEALA